MNSELPKSRSFTRSVTKLQLSYRFILLDMTRGGSFAKKNKETVIYLCFLKVWKALSLPKLDRLSVAGWNGTEWMKVETEGESWNRQDRGE